MAHWFHSIPPWILVLVTSLPVLIFTLPNAF